MNAKAISAGIAMLLAGAAHAKDSATVQIYAPEGTNIVVKRTTQVTARPAVTKPVVRKVPAVSTATPAEAAAPVAAPVAAPATATAPAASHLYLGLEGGYQNYNLDKNHGNAGSVAPRISAGYIVNDNVAVEAGLTTGVHKNNGQLSDDPMHDEHKSETKVSPIADVSVIAKSTETLPGAFVRVGATYSAVKNTTSDNTVSRFTYRDRYNTPISHKTTTVDTNNSGFGAVVGLGYEKALNNHVSVNASVNRYQGIGGDLHDGMNAVNVGTKYTF